jgi:FkbM family methyltransferase
MMIFDEYNKKIDTDLIEKYEQDLANKYISPNDVVLELGARYGSVSCTINNKLYNKKNQLVVEPDSRVWSSLEYNREINKCEFSILKGFISKKKLDLVNLDVCMNGYGSTSTENINTRINSYSLEEVKKIYGLNFNVLVADCEGFLEEFLDENPEIYDTIRLIIFEADYTEKCNYDKINNNLRNRKFVNILNGHQNVWMR